MKIPAFIVACLFSITAFAQTGNNANFRTALENDLFDLPNSNFGYIATVQIDTVMMVSNNKIVVFKKSYYQGSNGSQHFYRETLTRANAGDIFAATNVQSLKAAVKKQYRGAETDSIFYIGFNKKFKSSKNSPKK
jgi:hypothetical protein